MRICYLLLIVVLSVSCTTMFKSQDYMIVQRADKDSPVYTKSTSNAWVSLNYEPENKDDAINDILSSGRWRVASFRIKERLKNNPGDEQLLTVLSGALFLERKHRAAKFYAQQVLKLNPNSHAAKNILGLCYLYNAHSQKDLKKAEKLFKQAFTSSPSEIASGLNLGFLHLRTKNAFFAQETFTEVISRCKSCQEAYLGLGIAKYHRGKFKEAVAAFEDGLDIADSDEILFHLALVYRYGGKEVRSLDKARVYFNKIVRGDSSIKSLRNQARSEVVVIDEQQIYRYQQKYDPKSKRSFSDIYLLDTADNDFELNP